jgi:hypothetical protein
MNEPFFAKEAAHVEAAPVNVITEPVVAMAEAASEEPVMTTIHVAELEAPPAVHQAETLVQETPAQEVQTQEPEVTAPVNEQPAELPTTVLHMAEIAPETAGAEITPLPAAFEVPQAAPEHGPSAAA